LILTAVSLCVGLIVLMYRVRQSSMAELDRAMRLMGNDVVILPEGVGLDTYMAGDIGEKSIPQDYVGYAGNMKPPLLSDCRGFYQRKAVADVETVEKAVLFGGIPVPGDFQGRGQYGVEGGGEKQFVGIFGNAELLVVQGLRQRHFFGL